jgi:hypothetical protein
MKRTGILNGQLIQQIANLGHTDTFLIGDAGMPVPAGVPIIDLVLTLGVPTFEQVLRAVCAETVVEAAVIATEADEFNPSTRPGTDPGHPAYRTQAREPQLQVRDPYRGIDALCQYHSASRRIICRLSNHTIRRNFL